MSSQFTFSVIDPDNPQFPHFSKTHESGIIAIGGNIDPRTLIQAYSMGIFPWYNDDLPLWWNPDPRFVLFPEELKVSKSMRSYFNNNKFTVTFNSCFQDVIRQCMESFRKGQSGTWLNEEMIDSYSRLNKMGYAHSIEVWNRENQLVGGLYGIAIGKMFFGESMFTFESNASKFGFITLVKRLNDLGVKIIDCQQETKHLASLGARSISREEFMEYVNENSDSSNSHLPLTNS